MYDIILLLKELPIAKTRDVIRHVSSEKLITINLTKWALEKSSKHNSSKNAYKSNKRLLR